MPPEKAKEQSGQRDQIKSQSVLHREETHFDPYLDHETRQEEQLTKINDARFTLKEERNELNRQKKPFDDVLDQMDAMNDRLFDNRAVISKLDAIRRNPPRDMTPDEFAENQRELKQRRAQFRYDLQFKEEIAQIRRKIEMDTIRLTQKEHTLIQRENRLNTENQAFYEERFFNRSQGQNGREHSSSRLPKKSVSFQRGLSRLLGIKDSSLK
jgi:hypothetical protein